MGDALDDESADEVEAATTVLGAIAAGFDALGVATNTIVVKGPTIERIIGRSDAIDAALISIIGRRHRLGHRVLMGSVGQGLLKYSHRPVLVVPAAAEGTVDTGLMAAIDQMIHVIDRTEVDDEFVDLRTAAEAKRDDPSSEGTSLQLLARLREAAHHFETDHPALVRAVNDVAYYLSGMGV